MNGFLSKMFFIELRFIVLFYTFNFTKIIYYGEIKHSIKEKKRSLQILSNVFILMFIPTNKSDFLEGGSKCFEKISFRSLKNVRISHISQVIKRITAYILVL